MDGGSMIFLVYVCLVCFAAVPAGVAIVSMWEGP